MSALKKYCQKRNDLFVPIFYGIFNDLFTPDQAIKFQSSKINTSGSFAQLYATTKHLCALRLFSSLDRTVGDIFNLFLLSRTSCFQNSAGVIPTKSSIASRPYQLAFR